MQRACAVSCFCSRFFRSGSWAFWSLSVSFRICPQLCRDVCLGACNAAKGAWPASRRPLPARVVPRSVHPACFPCSPGRSPCFLVAPRLTSLMWVLTSCWAHHEASAILPLMLVFLPGTLLELDAADFSEGEPSAPSHLALWLGNPHQVLRPVQTHSLLFFDCWPIHNLDTGAPGHRGVMTPRTSPSSRAYRH